MTIILTNQGDHIEAVPVSNSAAWKLYRPEAEISIAFGSDCSVMITKDQAAILAAKLTALTKPAAPPAA